MASFNPSSSSSSIVLFAIVCLLVCSIRSSNAQLTTDFYSSTCPQVLSTVLPVVQAAIKQEARMGASLLRLHFHDCFVNGCDGSVLLDDTATFIGEKTAVPNNNSLRGFEVIDQIKTAVENVCPGVVSCADILAITARDSVVTLGGPTWNVTLGRRDATTASLTDANNDIPNFTSDLAVLIQDFKNVGLSASDLVALSGAHTIGQARCVTFRTRIYNESTINTSFATTTQSNCPLASSGDNNLAPLDIQTPTTFDNDYFNNLINQKGLLHSDQQLFSGGSTNALVQTYNSNPSQFNTDFAASMSNMGNIKPLTGSNGEVRTNCKKIN